MIREQRDLTYHLSPNPVCPPISLNTPTKLLGSYVDLFALGQIIIAPFEVTLWPGGPSREPDILFVSRERFHLLTSEQLNGAPAHFWG